MKNLEFEDNQGVVLLYTAANSIERVASMIIDYAVLFVLFMMVGLIQSMANVGSSFDYLFFLVFVGYSLILERLTKGQSIGKMALGLRVVKLDGSDLNFDDSFQRWILRIIDIFLGLGSVAILSIESSPRAQRLGDVLADTSVVKTRNVRVPLDKLLSLDKLEYSEAKYERAGELKEAEVLFIRKVVVRSKKYTNDSSKQLLYDTAKRIASRLGEVVPAGGHQKFLEEVIRDYVRLTR